MVSTLNFSLALASLPTLQLFAVPPPDVSALVKSILEEFYTDGIDQIVSAQLNDKGNIVGEFIDQVGARQVKRYAYRIADDDVIYSPLNPNEVSKFAFESFKPLFGKGSRAGQKKHCKNSTSCGDSCQALKNKDGSPRQCRKKPGSATKAKIQEAKQKLSGEGKSTPKKAETPKLPASFSTAAQGILLALPAAGQTSAPSNKRNGPPLTLKELQGAIYKEFNVTSAEKLRESGMFNLATNGKAKTLKLKDPEELKSLYRNFIGVLPDEVFDSGPKAINGVDITKYNRPWAVFGIDPQAQKYNTAKTKGLKGKEKKAAQEVDREKLDADVKKSFKGLAAKYHPDVGGDREVFEKLVVFKDSLLAKW